MRVAWCLERAVEWAIPGVSLPSPQRTSRTTLVAKVFGAARRGEVRALGVEDAVHVRAHEPALYALRVVPRAPNF